MDNNTVVGRMAKVKARLMSIPDRLGVPNFHHVVVQLGNTQVDLGRLPVLSIDLDDTRRYLSAQVETSPDDLQITNIPRLHDENLLQRGAYMVNPTLDSSDRWVGVRHTLIYLDKSGTLDYKALVRKQGTK
ncbi:MULTISPECIES: hypothetical protein [Floridanema]|uniref:Uncharacterized protein n=2 Tax=Floridanema TaxID=3396149 RepID=A0ABV4YI31_9CYAN